MTLGSTLFTVFVTFIGFDIYERSQLAARWSTNGTHTLQQFTQRKQTEGCVMDALTHSTGGAVIGRSAHRARCPQACITAKSTWYVVLIQCLLRHM